MSLLILGCIFILFGSVSVWDAYRITLNQRKMGLFDSLGPDGYLLFVAIVLIVLGVCLIFQAIRSMKVKATPVIKIPDGSTKRHLWLLGAMCGYVITIFVLGYAIATLLFFVATLWIMGRRWPSNLIASTVLTALFVVLFQYLADMPFPSGLLPFPI